MPLTTCYPRALALALLLPALAACDGGAPVDPPDAFPGDDRLLGMWAGPAGEDGLQAYVHFAFDEATGTLRVRRWEHDANLACAFPEADYTAPGAQVTDAAVPGAGGETVAYAIAGSTLTLGGETLTWSTRTAEAMTPECPGEDGVRIASVLVHYYTNGEHIGSDNSVYTYDASGRLAEITRRGPNGSVYSRQVYTYDATGLLTEVRNIQTGGIDVHYRYDAARRISEVRTTWFGGTDWDSFLHRSLYAYDARGLTARITHEDHRDAPAWEPMGRDDYAWNADETLREIIYYGGLEMDPEQPMQRSRYFYTAGRRDHVESDGWVGGAWALRSRMTYRYNARGNVAERTFERVGSDGAMALAGRYLYTWERAPGAARHPASHFPHPPEEAPIRFGPPRPPSAEARGTGR